MNTSGIQPVNCNVLVKPDEVDEKRGGLFIPDSVREKEQYAQTTGTLVALCPDAFHEMGEDTRPKPGVRIFWAKYGGAEVKGSDGVAYRLLKDIDVTGVSL